MKNTDKTNLDKRRWWSNSDYAEQFYACERPFLDVGLRQSVGPSVLQVGAYLDQTILDDLELPFLLKTGNTHSGNAELLVDPAFLPFAPNSFSTVILPHVLETHGLHHQILREAHRVLQPEGHIVLTGFSPHSLLGLQRFVRPKAVCPGHYYSVSRVIDWLQLLGFEVVTHSMFQYAPLSKRQGVRNSLNFLEVMGSRCLPMLGGGYMISAKKRDVGHVKVGRLRYQRRRSKLVTAASRKESISNVSNNCISNPSMSNKKESL